LKRDEINFLFASTKSNITTSPLSISRDGKFTRKKAINRDFGVDCGDSQAKMFLLPETLAPPPYLGQDYD